MAASEFIKLAAGFVAVTALTILAERWFSNRVAVAVLVVSLLILSWFHKDEIRDLVKVMHAHRWFVIAACTALFALLGFVIGERITRSPKKSDSEKNTQSSTHADPPHNLAMNRVSMGHIWWDKNVGYFKRETRPPESFIAWIMELGNESVRGKKTGAAGKVRAQMVLRCGKGEYRASPCAWVNEPYSSVDFDVADTRWLILAAGLGHFTHWTTVVNRRTATSDPQGVEYNNDVPGGGIVETDGTIQIDLVSSESGNILITYELSWRWMPGNSFWISDIKQLL